MVKRMEYRKKKRKMAKMVVIVRVGLRAMAALVLSYGCGERSNHKLYIRSCRCPRDDMGGGAAGARHHVANDVRERRSV